MRWITRPSRPVDHDIDPSYIRTVIRGQEESDPGYLFEWAKTPEKRLAKHVVGLFRNLELLPRLIGFDHTR